MSPAASPPVTASLTRPNAACVIVVSGHMAAYLL
jgi:hypothetical protein